jgi:hypothetical protein
LSSNHKLEPKSIWIVFTNLTPYIPLSFKGEGKRFIERGFTPLLPTLPLPLLREGGQGDRLLNNLNMLVTVSS